MKIRHLLMAGLGLISFISISVIPVQKAFGQERVVEDDEGRPYLAVPEGYDVGPHIRCSRDGEHCFNLNFVGCKSELQMCFYQLALINQKTIFHNSSDANSCWNSGDIDLIVTKYIDCRIYGVPKEISEYNKRRGQNLQEELNRIREELDEIMN